MELDLGMFTAERVGHPCRPVDEVGEPEEVDTGHERGERFTVHAMVSTSAGSFTATAAGASGGASAF
jgi:hypothetical protein